MGADPPISGALFRVRRPFDLKWAVRLGGRPFHEMGGVITRAVRVLLGPFLISAILVPRLKK
jgi:hypothetical protein